MSREAREWAWNEAPTDDPRKLLILLSLADVTDEYGCGAYPSKARLARDSRSSERSVQRHLSDLVAAEILEVEQKATQHRPTTYCIPALRGDNLSSLEMSRGDTGETNGVFAPLIGIGSKSIVGESSDVIDLCEFLSRRVGEYHGGPSRRPKITPRWSKDMDLLLRLGPSGIATPRPVKPAIVHRAIAYIFDELAEPNGGGFCWAKNIQSPGKLREKWFKIADEKKSREASSI